MQDQNSLGYCKKCETKLSGSYCFYCGAPVELKRIDRKYVFNEIGSVLNFDKGILYTVKELLLRPGKTVQEFILEDRNRIVKPIVFIIVCSLIYTLFQQLLNFEDGYVNYSQADDSTNSQIFEWVSNNYGYANIVMALFIALWIKIFFRKYGYNYFEILILLCFTMGMGMLFFAFFGIIDGLSGLRIIDKGMLIGIVYIAWAIGQFFDKKKIFNYLKAFSAYLLGFLTFSITVVMIGFLIDYLK
ncbi:DUF3667 domain-containing protein [Algoriphagus winogradskyi]|jgi:hypothetical protein|uniref:DUF3667 domain-containing protein n=1 Tax=Algoriphagus winogradskyi TaxID=237017 RepID=A0ABY1PB26_9BACT|nr:DUF3667 domain-containing protein [Algoriphagus winogradskyi]SMP29749.1 Protein of unknown function [Algoriphagus winogradskyi]